MWGGSCTPGCMWACLSLLNRAHITEWLQGLTHRLAPTVSPLPFACLEVLRSLSATPIVGPPAAHLGLRDGAETEGLGRWVAQPPGQSTAGLSRATRKPPPRPPGCGGPSTMQPADP